MSLPGPILLVADASGLAQALADAGAFPVVEVSWPGAQTALTEIKPAAIVTAPPRVADDDSAAALARLAAESVPFVPLMMRLRDDTAPAAVAALPVTADASPERL